GLAFFLALGRGIGVTPSAFMSISRCALMKACFKWELNPERGIYLPRIWFDSRCNPNQTVVNFGSVPRATRTRLSGWSNVYPSWI
ncbi:hypothetical protein, partial [Bacteroides acidifaciens]|uniref:hypothetical protein n=1 Tax=Bacteroides acidifaciens TaxID=85831 RepID=UPI0025951FCA